MKGDYLQADGNRSHNNVYLFRFAIDGGKIQRVGEYANPVTFAKLADLPIGGVRPPSQRSCERLRARLPVSAGRRPTRFAQMPLGASN